MQLSWVGLDATEMGKSIYLKKDFREIGWIDRWQLARGHEASQMPGIRRDQLALVSELDREATGINRDSLLFQLQISRDVEFVVCEQENKIIGFGLSRPGRLGPSIGPVVARSPQVAGRIVSRLLAPYAPRADSPVFIDVPRGSAIEPWLKAEGFEVVRSWTRMIRGKADSGNPKMVFAIAGPELG
jgi:hypothetical protein